MNLPTKDIVRKIGPYRVVAGESHRLLEMHLTFVLTLTISYTMVFSEAAMPSLPRSKQLREEKTLQSRPSYLFTGPVSVPSQHVASLLQPL